MPDYYPQQRIEDDRNKNSKKKKNIRRDARGSRHDSWELDRQRNADPDPISARLPNKFGSLLARVDRVTPGSSDEMDPMYKETRTPEQIEQLKTPEEKNRARFNQDAANTAQSILKANRDRLDQQQSQYTNDQNPNSPHWQQLWQVAGRRRELQQAQSIFKEQRKALKEEFNHTLPPADLSPPMMNPGESQEAFQKRILNHPFHKRMQQLQSKADELQGRIDLLEQTKVSLEFEYPGVRAVQGETGANPGDIQSVLERMPREFDGVRNNIDQLSKDLKKDPSAVINLDSVVSNQLNQWRMDKSLPPDQIKQVEQSIKNEKESKKRNELASGLVGGVLTLGSFLPQLKGAALLINSMRGAGAGLSLYSAASSLPDLMMLDKATQSQRGGAGSLTSQNEGEAKFNLFMGYTNLVLAGVDAGVPKLALNVAKSTGNAGLQAFSKLDRTTIQKLLLTAKSKATGQSPEWIQAMEDLKKVTGHDKNLYQRISESLKNAADKFPPPGGSPELAKASGPSRVPTSKDVGTKNLPMQHSGKGGGRTAKQRRNLEDHENAGGHSTEKHVGKSDNWLRNRFKKDPDIEAASTFYNDAAGNRAQGQIVKQKKVEIEEWNTNNKKSSRLVVEIEMNKPTGKVLLKGENEPFHSNKVRAIIIRDKSQQGWYILTSFPIP